MSYTIVDDFKNKSQPERSREAEIELYCCCFCFAVELKDIAVDFASM